MPSKKAKKPQPVAWKEKPDAHDYLAAYSYLTLHFEPKTASTMVEALKSADMTERANKDLLRASGLTLLPVTDKHVQKNLRKVKSGVPMAPILVVVHDGKAYIADGYHRLCAIWHHSYDEMMPCQIVW